MKIVYAFILGTIALGCAKKEPPCCNILFENSALHSFDSDLNRNWLISSSGKVYYTNDSAASIIPRHNPAFYTETNFGVTPVHQVSDSEMKAIVSVIDSLSFFSLPRYAADSTAQDGAIIRITISNTERIHTVTLVNIEQTEVRILLEAINKYLPERYRLEADPLW